VAIAGGACEAGHRAAADLQVVLDTVAGVPHVRNVGPAPIWRIDRAVALGEGAEGLGRIVSVVADSPGRIYVADGLDQRIHVFGPDGRPLRSMGRRGGGPGEFRALYSLAWVGDTLAALDPGNARITLLTRDGRPAGTWHTQALSGDARVVRLYPAGLRQFFALAVRPAAGGSERVYVRYGPAGPSDTLPGPAFDPRSRASAVACHRPDGGISFFDVPFAPSALTTLAPDGDFVQVWLADYRIVFLHPGGDTARVVERGRVPVPITDEEWRTATASYEEFLGRNVGAGCEPRSLPRATAKPAVRHVLFDDERRLWVEATTAAGWEWDVFDPSGQLLGTMPAPSRDEHVEPFVRNGRIYLVTADSLGEARVEVHRFALVP
jgi:6-bladed beta-propeller